MATDTRAGRGSSPAKYDAFVASQLAKAESRIRTFDLVAALLIFLAATLVFAVLMALIDSKWVLSASVRQAILWLYLGGAGVYLVWAVFLPLRRRINPYYAARKVEATVPGAKNSVINWVDLHDRKLPPAIRSAVGQRAARDLGRADIDRAISGRRAGWAGALAGAAVLGFLIAFFVLGRGPFFSLLGRTFAPFGTSVIPTRTQLALVQPEDGNAVVTVDRPFAVVVRVSGKLPDPKGPEAVRLLYRYEEGEPYQERKLQPEAEGDWGTTLSAAEVRNGFWYRIAGGDAVTPEYRVTVRAPAALTEFLATYHFRPYVARADVVNHERELKALRGTEVVLWARTNRAVRDARLEWEGKGGLPRKEAQLLPGDPQSFQVSWVLQEEGQYRLAFTATDGETYIDPARHTVSVIEDTPPKVELTLPGKDVSLPANGLLRLEGKADDDIGVKSIELHAQVDGGTRLQARPYREPEKMRLSDGGYPVHVDYSDSLDLASAKGEDGKPVALKAGMEVEYWLEAADACDYERHVSQSKHYKVKLTEPDKNAAQQQQERKKAADEQKKHEQKQDEKRKQEEQKRAQERQEQEQENRKEKGETGQPKAADPEPGGDPEGNPKPEGNKGDEPQNDPGKPDNPELPPDVQKKADELQKKADELQKANQENQPKAQQGNDGKQAEAKPDNQEGPGEAKPDNKQGDSQKGQQGNAGQNNEGEGKQAGQQGAQGAGEDKKQGPQGGAEQRPAEGKGGGLPDPMNGQQGEAKPEGGNGQAGQEPKGEDKGKGQDNGNGQQGVAGQQQRAEGKPSGSPEQSKDAGQGKPDGNPGTEGMQSRGEAKDAGPQGGKPEDRQAAGEAKEMGGQGEQGNKSEGKSAGSGSPEGQGAGKSGAGQGDNTPSGEGKGNPQGGQGAANQGDAKPAGGSGRNGSGSRPEDATPQDVEKLIKDLQGGDEQARKDAAEKLQQIEKQARDQQAQQGAHEALEEMKKGAAGGEPNPGNKPMGDPQPGRQGGNNTGDSNPARGGQPSGGATKTGGGGNPQGRTEDKGPGEKREGEPKGPNDPSDPKGPRGSGKKPQGIDPGTGRPSTGTDRPVANSGGQAGKPSAPESHRPGVFQLDDLRKRVNKDVLEKAHMTEEEYRKFLKEYEEALKQYRPKPRTEPPAGPQPVEHLPSIGGKAVKPGGGTDDLGSDAKALPPAPYRDAYRKFTEQFSRPDKK